METQVRSVAAVLVAAGIFASAAQAAPRAQSAMECGVAADMAVVAHSLARERIERQKADAIMVRIYDVSESDRGKELMRDIMDAAYSARDDAGASAGGTASGRSFAENLFSSCIKSGGDMDGVLGRRS